MSQTAITLVFEQWKAQQAISGEPVLLDEFVFALVPGLNPDLPVDRNEGLPPAAQIVHREAVNRKGVVNENAVVHSAVLGADVGDFSFNWIGLVNKASGTLAMIVHAPEQQKRKTKEGQQGNVLTRSFLMEYAGAQVETGINTPAETWQIDFTARMAGMDERQRLENMDIYGDGAFFGDGWMVVRNGNQYTVTHGVGYVGGLRAVLEADQAITVTTKPVKVWLDVCWQGTLTSAWGVKYTLTVAETLKPYQQDGAQHYVFALASIDASGVVTDLRPKGTLGDQQGNSDFVRKDKNLADLDDAAAARKNLGLGSAAVKDSGVFLATASNLGDVESVTEARKNLGLGDIATHDAKEFVPVTRTVNKKKLDADISLSAADVGAVPTTGGDVGYLDNAEHYHIKDNVWPGGGMFQNQVNDRRALFYSANFNADGNVYLPMTKATVTTAEKGYRAAISHGVLVSGNADYPSYCIHVCKQLGDGSFRDSQLIFNPNNDSLTTPGSIYAGDAILEKNGDVYGPVWGGWLSQWLGNNMTTQATTNWVIQNFVQNIDLTAATEIQFWDGRGYPKGTDGGAMYNLSMVGGANNVGTFHYRYLRKLMNGQWIVIN